MKQLLALVVEDEPDLAEIFAHALTGAGFQPEIIQRGDLARQRLMAVVPGLVILDLHLPHLGGEALLRQIRSDPRLANTRVIIASADPLLASTLDGQADLVLIKPVSFRQLRDLATRLRTVISQPDGAEQDRP